jgi:hypothetical protein
MEISIYNRRRNRRLIETRERYTIRKLIQFSSIELISLGHLEARAFALLPRWCRRESSLIL